MYYHPAYKRDYSFRAYLGYHGYQRSYSYYGTCVTMLSWLPRLPVFLRLVCLPWLQKLSMSLWFVWLRERLVCFSLYGQLFTSLKFKELQLHNRSESDRGLYDFAYPEYAVPLTPEIMTFPPESLRGMAE